jgi:hypothetical protein
MLIEVDVIVITYVTLVDVIVITYVTWSRCDGSYIYYLIDWSIIYGFTSCSRNFHLYGDVTTAGEGLQNFGLCSALRVFQHGGIFIMPHLPWHGASVFPVSSEGPPHSVTSYDTEGMWIYSDSDPHGTILLEVDVIVITYFTCSKCNCNYVCYL